MRILLLNEYFPPDTSATAKMAALVASALARRHEVTVLAGRPSYDPDEHYPFAFLRRERRDGIAVERVGSTVYSRHQMRKRLANYLSYVSLAVPRALSIKTDLILAMTDPPFAGIVGAMLAGMKRVPFVYNIRDLYPDMAVGGDIVRPRMWVSIWEKLHRVALRRAGRVIVLGDDMRDRILAKGVDARRVVVVRDGISLPVPDAQRDHPAIREIRGSGEFIVLHAGNLGFYGAWPTLLDAARILPQNGIRLVFVGDGASRNQLERSSQDCGIVRFLPFRPANEIPCVLAAGDVHVVTIRRGLDGVVVPSKLYSILAAGRPVLAVAPEETDVARVVRRERCGLVADPDKPAEVAAAIESLKNDPVQLALMGQRAREASRQFARANELDKFVSVVEEAKSHAAQGHS
ncbi:MAG TPA: glycosyltransferase family 4 protein [Candidatus Acidoferrales bacterium]|nr:glycosyltransferase family 4 protein [Candidatus Acidoferrales bacterium]